MVIAKMQNVSANGLCCSGMIIASVALSNEFTMDGILMISEGESGEGIHIKLLLCGGMYGVPQEKIRIGNPQRGKM